MSFTPPDRSDERCWFRAGAEPTSLGALLRDGSGKISCVGSSTNPDNGRRQNAERR